MHHVMEALCSVPSRIVGGPSLGVPLVLSHSRPMHAFRVLKIKGPKPWCPLSTQTTGRETRTNNHESSYKKWKREITSYKGLEDKWSGKQRNGIEDETDARCAANLSPTSSCPKS